MGVGDGEGVAVAPDERDAGQCAAELGGHARAGFDGEDVGAAGVQEGGAIPVPAPTSTVLAPDRGRPASSSTASRRAGG
ncbi:hypothetical protein EASAB2608_03930 [Streptomyces sp. EAS-AB2608]|nr:hypothetical protein EASAB2608_03930 [Streptomyces sp. EAS-AB2608]